MEISRSIVRGDSFKILEIDKNSLIRDGSYSAVRLLVRLHCLIMILLRLSWKDRRSVVDNVGELDGNS